MPIYSIQLAGVTIGHIVLGPEQLRARTALTRFEPSPDFPRHRELFRQHVQSILEAGRLSEQEKDQLRTYGIAPEPVGPVLVGPDGKRVGRLTGLTDSSTPDQPDRWEAQVLLDEPSYRRKPDAGPA